MPETSIEETIDLHIQDLKGLFALNEKAEGEALAPPQRQILNVETVAYYSAGYQIAHGAQPASQSHVKVGGTPSPSSSVTQGYILFVPQAEIQPPVYDSRTRLMRVWLDIAALPFTLEQLKHSKRHLWIGWFANDQAYADLHTSP